MTYQQTVNEIRNAANAVNKNGRFDHGRIVDLSQAFNGSYPLIWLYPWRSTDPNVGDFLSTHPLVIGFWMQDRPDTSTLEREEIIAKMEVLKDSFIEKLRENSQVDLRNVSSEPQYQMHNGTLSGYAVSFTYQNFSPCP
jgi:hypothetical protein